MRKSIDKRNTGRIRIPNSFIEYKVKGSETPFKVEIVNISSGGLCFLRNSILTKNDVLLIKFPFKNAKVILEAQVLRLDGREVGVKFLNSEEEIGRFVEAFNYEYPSLSREAKGKGQPLLFTKPSRDDDDDPDSALDID